MSEQVLLQNRRPDRPATLEEYRASGGYEALAKVLGKAKPRDLTKMVLDSGLKGRGGAGFPTGRKWSFLREDAPHPRYVIPNTDEMEPGTFKDRILVGADPHQIIEGTILAGYANQAQRAVIFIRPSYELEAEILEGEFAKLREANLLGTDILGSGFDFDITLHRSAGRYICGEASAQVKAIQGERPRPDKESHMTDSGLWGRPTIVNNVETLACLPHILRHGAEWFKGLALTPGGDGTKLFGVSGMVNKPDCYETPMGTPLREIIFEHAGGMKGGREFKACLTGGASTKLLPAQHLDVAMDFESLAKIGHRLGTGAIIVFDQGACLVSACLNLLTFFARESCGWCTPCREGLPYMRHLLLRIELGDADEGCVKRLREMAHYIDHSYCAFAPGAAAPVLGLLEYFEDEVLEHISQGCCPYKGV
ncbi:complex I 51 kDa subunit family protein [Desulfoferula mesophila]|uniref:NADH-quinone oxidoreductase subunit F n=1 Tax=Desulfoferula mesophila TaxID=3058419 RepID=A0AAU9F198_9BACT|nr:NADH-quinone oxidoreductase subunit F [Desulfoferula mesophilus]